MSIDLDTIEARHQYPIYQCCKDVAALVSEIRATTGDLAVAVEVARERGAVVDAWHQRLADVQAEYRKAAEYWDQDRARLTAEVERLRTGTDWSQGDEWKRGYEVGCEASHNIGCDAAIAHRDALLVNNERLWAVAEAARQIRAVITSGTITQVRIEAQGALLTALAALDAWRGGEDDE